MLEDYFKVSSIVDYFGSDVSDGRNYRQDNGHRKSSVEFGNLFKTACDELKEKAGDTHQSQGYDLNVGTTYFTHMVPMRLI